MSADGGDWIRGCAIEDRRVRTFFADGVVPACRATISRMARIASFADVPGEAVGFVSALVVNDTAKCGRIADISMMCRRAVGLVSGKGREVARTGD